MSESVPEPRSSPAAGCIILTTIVVVFGGLLVLYTARGLWMNREIDKFTASAPESLPIAEVDEARGAAVAAKLTRLRDAALNNTTERVTLNADDLNLLIATQPLLADFRGTAHVESISADGITTRVSQKLRALRPGTFRYLNGNIDFIPVLRRITIVMQIRDLTVPGKEVPRKFVESYSSQDFFKLDSNNAELEPVLRKLERVYLEDGEVVIEVRRESGAEKVDSSDD